MKYKAHTVAYLSHFLGLGSLLFFTLFLFLGQFTIINFDMTESRILLFDSSLSLLFFFQHSIMIRKTVRKKISEHIGAEYYAAFYSIVSGIILIIMILLWQKSSEKIFAVEGLTYWMLRALFFISLAGFYWGITSLRSFDPFGVNEINRKIYNKLSKPIPLSVNGAYKFMRHPLYFFLLIMIWASPELTSDRLVFNILWSAWIFVGAMFEERDLISEFGDQYREYQKKVPMIIPYKIF